MCKQKLEVTNCSESKCSKSVPLLLRPLIPNAKNLNVVQLFAKSTPDALQFLRIALQRNLSKGFWFTYRIYLIVSRP